MRLKLDGDSLKVLVSHGVSRDPLMLKVFLCKHDACVCISKDAEHIIYNLYNHMHVVRYNYMDLSPCFWVVLT